MIEQAISELQNERPIITLAVEIIPIFLPIINKYNWEKTSYTITPDCIQGMYSFNEHPKEHIYKKRIDTKKFQTGISGIFFLSFNVLRIEELF